jgi:hypothetical protein
MLKQFYDKVLPKQGVYCVAGITKEGVIEQSFSRTLEDVFEQIDYFKQKEVNVYVTPGAYSEEKRVAELCVAVRSFFIDVDTHGKDAYGTKEETLSAIIDLTNATGLPEPVFLDSGGGMHAYWIMDRDIPYSEWKPYAIKLKALCLKYISIDKNVTADAARLMRCPYTSNYRYDPIKESFILSEELHVYDFDEFKSLLDESEPDVENVLATVTKGLDEETRAMLRMDNFKYTFGELADKSVNDTGCNQIKYMLLNPNDVSRDHWAAGLTIAVHCEDGDTAIHEMSNEYENYSHEETEKTARSFEAPRTCEWFIDNFPEHCEGCINRGKIKTPIVLGRELKIATTPSKKDSIREVEEEVVSLPDFLFPFVRGELGGIYYIQPPKTDAKTKKSVPQDPILLLSNDLQPFRRLTSKADGDCLMMRLVLPMDGVREFLLPMKAVYAMERFKEIMSSNGVLYDPDHVGFLMKYIIKWGQYLEKLQMADIMRMQMGWTEERESDKWARRSFIIGYKEIRHNGEEVESAASPYVRSIAKFLLPVGSKDRWRRAADELNTPSLEMHAFVMLCGFGTILMPYCSTSGVCVSLVGKSGSGKTGAMYGGLSVFGNPKELSIFDSTDNGMVGRFLGLHNLMFGVDELSNTDGKTASQLIHKISHGKAKIRMQASVNAEREHEMSASLIAVFTTNGSIYTKLEGIKANPDGEVARLLEFDIKKPSVLEGEDGGILSRQIFDTFRTNFGWAGPDFVKAVFQLGDDYILDTMEIWRARFVKDFGDESSYRFYENLVMATFTAGTIAVASGIITLDLDRVYKKVIKEIINIRDNIIKLNRSDYESILGDFMVQHVQNQLSIRDGMVKVEPRGKLVARVEQDKGTYLVSKTEFKDYLRQKSINHAEFERDMTEKGILIAIKKSRLTSGWKGAAQPENVWVYEFKTSLDKVLVEE